MSPVTILLDAQFGTPYPRSAGFDTDIGAFIESSSMPLQSGRMPFPVFKDGAAVKGALATGQTIRLGGFLMTACLDAAPTMTSQVIKSDLHINSEFAKHHGRRGGGEIGLRQEGEKLMCWAAPRPQLYIGGGEGAAPPLGFPPQEVRQPRTHLGWRPRGGEGGGRH